MRKINQQDTPKAMKIFTDRDPPQKAFKNKYNKLKSDNSADEPHVLTFYGMGGIGKTELLKKLRESLKEGLVENNKKTVEKPFYIYYEFNNKSLEPTEILYQFAYQLFKNYGFKFSLFEAGYCCINGKTPQKKGSISDIISLALDAIAMIPMLNLPTGIAKITSGVLGRVKAKKSENAFEELKVSLDRLDSKEREAELISLFEIDFRINMEKYSKKNKEPLVIFLDTYEALVDEFQTVGEPLNNDLWLRGEGGLIFHMKNVLWVISGQQILKWKDLDIIWKDAAEDNLEQHSLGRLSELNSKQFLQAAGITEDDLRNGLYKLTKGWPLYLDLCVESYHKHGFRSIDEFGKSRDELIYRFCSYMDDDDKEKILILSCLESWDYQLYNFVTRSFNIPENEIKYKRFMSMSIINQDIENPASCLFDGKVYSLDKLVRKVLFDHCSQEKTETKKKALDTAIKYYSEKLQNIAPVSAEGFFCLKQMLDYAVKLYSDDKELTDFYYEKIHYNHKLFLDKARFADAEAIMSSFAKRAEQNKDGILYATKRYFDSILNLSRGRCSEEEILQPAQQAYELFKSKLGEDHYYTLNSQNIVTVCLMELGKFECAREPLEQLLNKLKNKRSEDDPDTLTAMNNLAMTYKNLQLYEKALDLEEQVFEKRKKIFGEDNTQTLIAMTNLATIYKGLNRYEKALELEEQVLEKRIAQDQDKDDLQTLDAMGNLAITYGELGKYDKAIELLNPLLDKYKENFGEDHFYTLKAMDNLASRYIDLKKYDDARKIQESLLDNYQKILGENHYDTLAAKRNLAAIYSNLGMYRDAYKLFKELNENQALADNDPIKITAKEYIIGYKRAFPHG